VFLKPLKTVMSMGAQLDCGTVFQALIRLPLLLTQSQAWDHGLFQAAIFTLRLVELFTPTRPVLQLT